MTYLPTAHDLISATQHWLNTVIIAHNICPFANREQQRGSIHYCTHHDTDLNSGLLAVLRECERLNIDDTIETTLLIFDRAFADFEAYLDFLDLAEALLIDQDYEGVYQLASFHPDYCFDGASPDDAANYTNRSPYPMVHLLRETSIDRAIANYPDPENIPDRNIALTRRIGQASMHALLAACYPAANR